MLYIHVKLKIFEREEVAINRCLRDTFVVCFSACHKSSRSCEWVQWCLFLNILKWHRFYRNKKKQWPKINKQTRETNRVEHFFLSVSSHYAVKHEWALTCLLDTTSTTLGVFGKNVLIYDKLFSYSLINQEKNSVFFSFWWCIIYTLDRLLCRPVSWRFK